MGQADSADLPDGLSGLFFARGLDDPNQVGIVREIAAGKLGRAVRIQLHSADGASARLEPRESIIVRLRLSECAESVAGLHCRGFADGLLGDQSKGRVVEFVSPSKDKTQPTHEISVQDDLMNVRSICNMPLPLERTDHLESQGFRFA
jgi:hypothetical protein